MPAIVYLLTLMKTPGFNRKKVWKTVPLLRQHQPARIQDLRDVLLASGLKEGEIPGSDELSASYSAAAEMLEQADKMGIAVIPADSEHYPERLRGIGDPPVLLFMKGNPACLVSEWTCAVIGTKEPSPYGRTCALGLGAMLARKGFVVVSGLARGCDTAAHQGCVQTQGRTVAVLAHGLDQVYPPENRTLADQILSAKGCLVSEYPPGVKAAKHSFIERDRIQSGLSSGLIVVETDTEGGTMHTVRFGLEQGRPIACWKHPEQLASLAQVRGNQKLIGEGKAVPLSSQEEVDAFLAKISGPDTDNDLKHNSHHRSLKKYLQPTLWGDDGD
jgi:DNA processing protein